MITNMNYISSVVLGIFIGSVILFASRLLGLPITGVILAIVFSSFVAAFVYNPNAKKKSNHSTLRGVSASVIFSIIFSVMLSMYYIPRLGSIFNTADTSIAVSVGIVLSITLLGGLVLGTISGTIGSTFRDLFSVFKSEKDQ